MYSDSAMEAAVQGKAKLLNYDLGFQEKTIKLNYNQLYRYSLNIHPTVQNEKIKIRINSELSGFDNHIGNQNFASTIFTQYNFKNSNWSALALIGNERFSFWSLIPGFSYSYSTAKTTAFLGFPINIIIYRFGEKSNFFTMMTPSDLRAYFNYSRNESVSLQLGYSNELLNFLGHFEKENERIEERLRTIFVGIKCKLTDRHNLAVQLGTQSSSGLILKQAESKIVPEQNNKVFAKLLLVRFF